ncbi:hypothetical protein ACFYKX_19820 [Cytobacillus sp. FJAT-54145]|uniref:DUF4025 domain-containing protein n=1 Tax=Cytobacillus spartinae TaxID=3299023 RepID=A0ABW6KJG8_9BACI
MKEEDFNQDTTAANIKIVEKLEDGHVHGSTDGLSEATAANFKIQEAFYGDDDRANEIAPTYMNNNTPAIKINEDGD